MGTTGARITGIVMLTLGFSMAVVAIFQTTTSVSSFVLGAVGTLLLLVGIAVAIPEIIGIAGRVQRRYRIGAGVLGVAIGLLASAQALDEANIFGLVLGLLGLLGFGISSQLLMVPLWAAQSASIRGGFGRRSELSPERLEEREEYIRRYMSRQAVTTTVWSILFALIFIGRWMAAR